MAGNDPERIIIKISVRPEAKRIISEWAKDNDMTEVGVASRIYTWFADQDEDVQRIILGFYGSRAPDLAKLILEQTAARNNKTRKPRRVRQSTGGR